MSTRWVLRVRYRLHLESSWHVGNGLEEGAVDRAVQRDGRGLPFVPGSALKGLLRDEADRLAQALDLPLVSPHARDHGPALAVALERLPFPVLRLFGTPVHGERAFVSDATLDESAMADAPEHLLYAVPRVAMDRRMRRARTRHLFSTQVCDRVVLNGSLETCHTTGELTDLLPKTDGDSRAPAVKGVDLPWPFEWALLAGAMSALGAIGGDRSLGRGRCRVEVLEVALRTPERAATATSPEAVRTLWEDLLAPLVQNGVPADLDADDLAVREALSFLESRRPKGGGGLVGSLLRAAAETGGVRRADDWEEAAELAELLAADDGAAQGPGPSIAVPDGESRTTRRYPVRVRLAAPVSVARSRQATDMEAREDVPGTTLRGALAAGYLRHVGEPEDVAFRHLFLDEEAVRFGPLRSGEVQLPRTVESCKRHGGPAPDGHGLMDALLCRIAGCDDARCVEPGCGESRKPWRHGLATLSADGEARAARASTVERAHVGIDRGLGSRAAGILYSEEAIAAWRRIPSSATCERVILHGFLEADALGRRLLAESLDRTGGTVHLGRSRTRGFGEGTLEIGEPDAEDGPDLWLARGRAAAAEVSRLAGSEGQDGWPVDAVLLALHLPNGAIFVDEVLRATNDPSTAIGLLPPLPPDGDLAKALEREVDGALVRLVYADTELELVRGWNAAHGLPKADDLALVPGSVFAYRVRGDEAAVARLFAHLHESVEHGIGLRRSEGFGRVVVNDAVHLALSRRRQPARSGTSAGGSPSSVPRGHGAQQGGKGKGKAGKKGKRGKKR